MWFFTEILPVFIVGFIVLAVVTLIVNWIVKKIWK